MEDTYKKLNCKLQAEIVNLKADNEALQVNNDLLSGYLRTAQQTIDKLEKENKKIQTNISVCYTLISGWRILYDVVSKENESLREQIIPPVGFIDYLRRRIK